MKNFKSHFKFNKRERSGIFFLLLLIILLQVILAYGSFIFPKKDAVVKLDSQVQKQIDSLKALALQKPKDSIYPFNPNYLTDYKGYRLGMAPEEVDRLLQYQQKGSFANSAKEFQQITGVSDSLLAVLTPYFRFPEWATKRKFRFTDKPQAQQKRSATRSFLDLNKVTAQELTEIRGIGDVLSKRIIKYRTSLKGFLINEQLYDVYGLEPQIVVAVLQKYKIITIPKIAKLDVNQASVEKLASLPYISYRLAGRIRDFRIQEKEITSWEEIVNLEGFPADRLERIKLYLYIKKE